jgi:hypothetical protein
VPKKVVVDRIDPNLQNDDADAGDDDRQNGRARN